MEYRRLDKRVQELDSYYRHVQEQAAAYGMTATDREGVAAGNGLVRLRGVFWQTGTVSGRLAMDEPNLQVSKSGYWYIRQVNLNTMLSVHGLNQQGYLHFVIAACNVVNKGKFLQVLMRFD